MAQKKKVDNTERAVVISYNWLTEETMHTPFEGDAAAIKAEGWVHKKSFLWEDFPEKDGWTHFAYWNDAAGKAKGEAYAAAITGEKDYVFHVPVKNGKKK